ncbi:MAG: 16S rRNA (cytosine(1402)-N(4))-methyltransferase RsmH [Myxococcota bacterium]|nr:16S rRNA (cytosine(1402)-N(4))-methyltransferase RsmH [Myxococcota bacterium]
MSFEHWTVLRDEAVSLLAPAPGKLVVDCTLGGGGHSQALLDAGCRVIGLDRDPAAIAAASARLESYGDRFTAVQTSFSGIQDVLVELGIPQVDGVLADLGVSSPQLDQAGRGFSFSKDGPLDMRMSQDGMTAAEYLEQVDETELADALYRYGEERNSRRIARAIKAALPLSTTGELAEVIAKASPGKPGRIHPATRSFQALRIVVNDELGELETLLHLLPGLLKVGGRAAIISFHSLEDRPVKLRFRHLAALDAPKDPFGNPTRPAEVRLLTRKAVKASDGNPRARSARLRAIERT